MPRALPDSNLSWARDPAIPGHLHFNRPSGQLSPRTPPVNVYPEQHRGVNHEPRDTLSRAKPRDVPRAKPRSRSSLAVILP